MFSTYNKDFQEEFFYNFDDCNQFRFDYEEDLYVPKGDSKSLHDSLALADIKSTEEVSLKNESSSLKNFPEDNEVLCKEEWATISESKCYDFDAIKNLAIEIRAKINSSELDKLIDEVIDIQACIETDFKENLIIQTKHKKSNKQKDVLENKLKEKQNWTTQDMDNIANELGLKTRQVYKWYWDRTKKRANDESNKNKRKSRNSKFEDIEATFGFQF